MKYDISNEMNILLPKLEIVKYKNWQLKNQIIINNHGSKQLKNNIRHQTWAFIFN